MPLCHLVIRSLFRSPTLPSRFRHGQSQTTWHQAPVKYSSASGASRRDDANQDLPESEYLDFVLGDSKPSNPTDVCQYASSDATNDRGAQVNLQDAPQDRDLKLEMRKASMEPATASIIRLSRADTSRHLSRQKRMSGVDILVRETGSTSASSKVPPHATIPLVDGKILGTPYLSPRARRRRVSAALERKRIALAARSANVNSILARQQAKGGYSKSVSLRSSFGAYSAFSRRWNLAFAIISGPYNRGIPRRLRPSRSAVIFSAAHERMAKLAIKNMEDGVRDIFLGLPYLGNASRLRRWQKVALWLMHHQPERMLQFLKDTNSAPYPPPSYIADCLQYLAWRFTQADNVSQEQIASLVEIVPLLADREDGERLCLEDTFCTDLIPHCSEEQVDQLYRVVKDFCIPIRWEAWLHFATHFNKHFRLEEGLDAILQAKNTGSPTDKWPFLSNCATLLRTSIRQPEGFRVCLRIVDNLVEMGVKLNTQLCNIIMLNAVESNDMKTALDVYSSLRQHGLAPDMYTFAVLLKGSKLSIDDANSLNSTIRDAIEHAQVMQQPIVATEILHCLALHHTKHHSGSAFTTVADAFAQMFDFTEIEKLGISFSDLSKPSLPASQRLRPSPQSVHILLSVYLDSLHLRSQSYQSAYETYQRFRSLAESGVVPFSSMIREDYIFNAFLVAFTKTKKGLLYAAELIKEMQRSQSKPDARTCAPTVRSWTIFLNGFTKHGHMKLAEQVLNYMAKQGIEPDQVAYNVLTAGYAGQQDIDGALNALRRIEAEGKVWDDFTFKGLRLAKNHDRLLAEMSRRRTEMSLDFTGDIKRGIERKMSIKGEAGEAVERSARADYVPFDQHQTNT